MSDSRKPLSRDELIRVIEGRGHAARVPLMIHFWVNPGAFGDQSERVARLLADYPCDIQALWFKIPAVYDAPADDPSYRWSWREAKNTGAALDNAGFIEDWDEDLPPTLADFPSPDYPGLTADNPPPDGRYRLGCWWYFFFERFWSVRGMENALTDFYLYPDEVHALFRRLTDFYLRMVERGRNELRLDGIFTSDDLGTQTGLAIGAARWRKYMKPCFRKLYGMIKAYKPSQLIYMHTDGCIWEIMPDLVECGVDMINPQFRANGLDNLVRVCRKEQIIPIHLDLDRQLYPYATPSQLKDHVAEAVESLYMPQGGLSLNIELNYEVPLENAAALLDAVEKYRHYKGKPF